MEPASVPGRRTIMATATRRLVLGAAAGALLTAGCGSSTAPGDPDRSPPPAGLEWLRLTVDGGFTTAEVAFRTLPQLTVTPDSRAITPAPVAEIHPGPMLLPLSERPLDDTGRLTLAEVVRSSGLATSPAPDLGVPAVADAPTTTLVVSLDGTVTILAAPALDEARPDDPSLTTEQQGLRADLRALLARLRDLPATVGGEHLGPETAFRPTGVWLWARPAPSERIPEQPEPVVLDWPVAGLPLAGLDPARLVEGDPAPPVLEALAGVTELTWFRDPPGSGPAYRLLARPALPGDAEDTPSTATGRPTPGSTPSIPPTP